MIVVHRLLFWEIILLEFFLIIRYKSASFSFNLGLVCILALFTLQTTLILRSLLLNFFLSKRSLWALSLSIHKLLKLGWNWFQILVLKSLPIQLLILLLKFLALQVLNWVIIVDCIVIVLKTSGNEFFFVWNIIILLIHYVRIVRASSIWIEHGAISKLASVLAGTNLIHLIHTPGRCVVVGIYYLIHSTWFSSL